MPKSPARSSAHTISDLAGQLTNAVTHLIAERAHALMLSAFGDAEPAAAAAAPRARQQRRLPPVRRATAKRDPRAIAAMAEKLAAHIAKHPGKGIEAIAKGLGAATKALVLPVKKLVAARRITTRGKKRATTYFPVAARAAKPETRRRATGKRATKPPKRSRPRPAVAARSKSKSKSKKAAPPVAKARPVPAAPVEKPVEPAAAAT